MPQQLHFSQYATNNQTVLERGLSSPLFKCLPGLDAPEFYIASQPLADAVNVALALGQPLLLTGEPGTGKTQLANSIAWQLNLPLYVFYTKTNTEARDLFYRYDSLGHFHDAQIKQANHQAPQAQQYIALEALGKAIANSQQERAVVLIDEIDKAPRDFPNDLLHELEAMEFRIRETAQTISVYEPHRPIIVITSNSEKNLPDAFLRRCVYYHIAFPDKKQLAEIVAKRIPLKANFTQGMVNAAIDHFMQIRESGMRKKPATAELLAWIHLLNEANIDLTQGIEPQIAQLRATYSILAKTHEDWELLHK
ncbi:MAG: MoxR family ATPase [Sphingobacteriales bacterium]|jgi:MoxR-like ATPase|nr:MoxR family ATPase [Sphingobacteriales bacterium]MBP9141309.1 MoxR family ATPase [Chitinophagales bacterium]MDA0197800.1 MoxR family ATPase [Bacteroidota bacterium]MBK6888889.1 MoxR family ATPase [Sphingobacteriales bacterium]MBK7528607.1 MoxR family ATPase [Sphingobacteriales bacterium]